MHPDLMNIITTREAWASLHLSITFVCTISKPVILRVSRWFQIVSHWRLEAIVSVWGLDFKYRINIVNNTICAGGKSRWMTAYKGSALPDSEVVVLHKVSSCDRFKHLTATSWGIPCKFRARNAGCWFFPRRRWTLGLLFGVGGCQSESSCRVPEWRSW